MIKVPNLWSKDYFKRLDPDSKLLYLSIVSNRRVTTVGTLSFYAEEVIHSVFAGEAARMKAAFLTLTKEGLIKYFTEGKAVTVFIEGHFKTVAKTPGAPERVQKDLSGLSSTVRSFLSNEGICPEAKGKGFLKPDAETIARYALECGHKVDGNKIFEYYEKSSMGHKGDYWYDSKGTRITDWKRKVRFIWCRDENKIKSIDGAPEGMEYLYIMDNGKMIQPVRWIKGLPKGGSVSLDLKLKREYERRLKEGGTQGL